MLCRVLQGTLPLPLVALILGRDVLLIVGSFAVRARALGWRWPGAAEFFRLGGTGHAEVRHHENLRCEGFVCLPLHMANMQCGPCQGQYDRCLSRAWTVASRPLVQWPRSTSAS